MAKIAAIRTDRNQQQLDLHLHKYVETAFALGATNAKVITAASIVVDERVTLKCQVPRCFGYGVGAHCPPHTLKPIELRQHLSKYQWAVLFTVSAPAEVIVRNKQTITQRVAAYQTVYKIVSALESAAFYDGHYLAVGFGAGSCRHTFCGLQPTCAAMNGEQCRFSLLARPSMEAVGIDVFQLVSAQGWEIYPIGSGADAQCVAGGLLTGIVIVQ